MAENQPTVDPGSSRKRQNRLRIVGIVIILLGLAAAGAVYWAGSGQPSEDELLPGRTRAESRQMEMLYGKMGLLTQEISDGLKRPGTRALLVIAVSIMAAAGCFYFARLLEDDSEMPGETENSAG